MLNGAHLMNSNHLFILLAAGSVLLMTACEPVETEEEAAATEYVTLNVSATNEEEGGTIVMTSSF